MSGALAPLPARQAIDGIRRFRNNISIAKTFF